MNGISYKGCRRSADAIKRTTTIIRRSYNIHSNDSKLLSKKLRRKIWVWLQWLTDEMTDERWGITCTPADHPTSSSNKKILSFISYSYPSTCNHLIPSCTHYTLHKYGRAPSSVGYYNPEMIKKKRRYSRLSNRKSAPRSNEFIMKCWMTSWQRYGHTSNAFAWKMWYISAPQMMKSSVPLFSL